MSALDAYLPAGLTVASLLAYAVGLITFASVMAAWRALLEQRPAAARIRAVTQRRLELQGKAAQPERRRSRGQLPPGLLPLLMRHLRRMQSSQIERIRSKLLTAGFRSREAVGIYAGLKLVSPFVLAALALLLVYGAQLGHLPMAWRPAVPLVAVLLGFLAPDLYLRNAAAKRRHALQKALPDGLDLLVICAEAGLSLDAALNRVAEEVAVSAPELADELALTAVELNFLPERRQALANLAKRVDLPAARGVVNTLIQTEKYGTPLAQSLRVLSAEFREQRMLRAEEKAARLPATMTVPMILFILPTLFIVLVGPAMIDVYDNMTK
ncbi:MAG: type II secretion system F family protein [Geminicoccaceae bacterium]